VMKRTTTVVVDIFLCRSVKFRDRIDTGEINKR